MPLAHGSCACVETHFLNMRLINIIAVVDSSLCYIAYNEQDNSGAEEPEKPIDRRLRRYGLLFFLFTLSLVLTNRCVPMKGGKHFICGY